MWKFLLFVCAAFAASFIILCLASGAALSVMPSAAVSLLQSANPLAVVALWALGFALTSFLAGLISGDYSWVDRLWSTLPIGFAWFYAWRGAWSPALIAASSLVSLWGLRLTWNFAMKGGYSGTEDYRWSILRSRIKNQLAWQAFNLGFISLFQVGLFVLFTMPLARLAALEQAAPKSLNLSLYILGLGLMVAAILYESIADRQQWDFQEAKRLFKEGKPVPTGYEEDIQRGFRSSGLFAASRHPNYFGELLTWWALYLGVSGLSGGFLDWSLSGPLVLSALFAGSTIFTEGITASKYPHYKAYQKRVSAIIPWFSRKG